MARRWWVVGVAAALVVLGLVVWLVWPSPPPPRARPYLDYNACLLTDAQGLAGTPARPAWAGMEDASLATHARVQYLPVTGEATVGNALPYLNGLLQRRCSVLVAVGPAQVDAVNSVAGRYPAVKFVVVGGRASAGNVTALDGSSDAKIHDAIRELVTDAVRSASH